MIQKSLNLVLALVLGVVGIAMLVSAGPGLVGDMIVDVDDSYISNATGTGCWIDSTPDVEVEAFYCTGFSLLPLIIIALFFVAVVGFVIGVFTGHIKLKGWK